MYVDRVLIPHQKVESAERGTPRGNLSDLYPRWHGSRELLLRQRDPYRADVTREIQSGYYGRPLDPALKSDPTDQQAFAYPVYVAFLFYPTIRMQFEEVQALFRWTLALLSVVSVPLWLRVINWRLSGEARITSALFLFSTFPVVQGIKLQQLSLLVVPLIAACVYFVVRGWLGTAGVLLAMATIKPQITGPLAGWLLFWSTSGFRQRWRFPAAFFVTLAALVSAGELVLPGWIPEFFGSVKAYLGYNPSRTLLDGLLGHSFAVVVESFLVGIALLACWRARRGKPDTNDFSGTTSLVLATNVLVMPSIAPYNQLLLLPGALLVLRSWNRSLTANGAVRIVRGTAGVFMIWYWFAVAVLAIASFFTTAEQRYWMVPLWTSIVMPFLLTVCVALLIHAPPKPLRTLS